MDVGGMLRQARIRKRLTLEQVARSTKIGQATLEALENNDFERLPAAVYTRGFVRAFAREVGLDPEETVTQYMEQFDLAPAITFAQEPDEVSERATEREPSHSHAIVIPRVPFPALAAIAIIIAAGIYLFTSRQNADTGVTTTAEASSTTPAAAPPPAPTVDVAHAANVEPDVLRVELTATGPCWVSATADRESALARLLQAGEHHQLQAKEELVLRVGDPSTVAISVNGVAARPLGRPGQPVTVQINKQNFREFQSS